MENKTKIKEIKKKGRQKGWIPKLANCKNCGKEMTNNTKICHGCLKPTGLWSV